MLLNIETLKILLQYSTLNNSVLGQLIMKLTNGQKMPQRQKMTISQTYNKKF